MSGLPQDELYEDIELASKRLAADQDRLSESQVNAIAKELGIDKKYIHDAQQELAKLRLREAAKKRRRHTRIKIGLVSIAAMGMLFIATGLSAKNSLLDHLADVRQAKAQLVNVSERQQSVRARLLNATPSTGKDAELEGAENRVRIQRKRYDERVTAYNRAANGSLASLWCSLFGLPTAIPLSSDPDFTLTGTIQ